MLKKINFRKVLDISIIILLFLTCFKRGGFYKSDVLCINLLITAIGIIYFCITSINRKKSIVSITSIFLFLLGISYFLSILLNNSADMSDSIFEMIRYFNLYIIYKLVNESDNPKIYQNGILTVTLIECVIGIDGIGNRFFSNILKLFNTGYLEKDFTRISSTIQYANVFAMLCAISLLILVFKLVKNDGKSYINKTLFTFIFSVLILTESRAVICIFIAFLLYYIISSLRKKKENTKEISIAIFLNVVISIIFSTIIYNFCMYNFSIYIVSFIAILLILGINYICSKYSENIVKLVNVKLCSIFVVVISLIYIVVALIIDTPIHMSDDMGYIEVTRNIYNVKSGDINNIKFKVEENENDSKYRIKLFEILNNLELIELREVGYFSTSTGTFDIDFELDENVKYIKISINCEEGNITLKDMKVNEENVKLNYLLIPSSLVYKVQDILNGSTSVTDRVDYLKDSIKIITASTKNFFIGVGGEGFKNTYELYQTKKYVSTEVHNSYLQIFVESGLIGFICIFVAIIYTFIKSSNKENKLLLLMFVIHSFIDLELSYFSMIFTFAILLAMCMDKDKLKLKKIKYSYVFVLPALFVIFVILFKANIAYGINIQKNTSNDIYTQKEIIKTLEKRVLLDKYDINYRNELNEEYEKYLKMLLNKYTDSKNNNLKDEIRYVIISIKNNADTMLKNSRYNKYVIVNVCNTYFNNFYYFSYVYYPSNLEQGYEKYLDFILFNLTELEKHKYNEVSKNALNNLYSDYYLKLEEKNKSINSLIIQNFVNRLKEKRSITII